MRTHCNREKKKIEKELRSLDAKATAKAKQREIKTTE